MRRTIVSYVTRVILPAAIWIFLLCGCAGEPGVVTVSTVDELLAAIGPNRTIQLAAGAYELSSASDYGEASDSLYYTWQASTEGYTLKLRGVENLTIQGSGEDCRITMVKPYPDVLILENSRGVTLENLSLSHAGEIDNQNSGGIRLENCEDVSLNHVNLHRCGAYGLRTSLTGNLQLTDSSFYDCALAGIVAEASRDVLVEGCRFYSIGGVPLEGVSAFYLRLTENVDITDCEVYDCALESLVLSVPCDTARMTNCSIRDIRFSGSALNLYGTGLVFDGNAFENCQIRSWYAESQGAVDAQGNSLTVADLNALLPAQEETQSEEEAFTSVTVSTVDEFLAAIGPNREIILEEKLYDLSTARGYGETSGEYYYWEWPHDGPALVISGAENLTIRSADGDTDSCTISAIPRYADVLTFVHCDNLLLSGFTAGHTVQPGICAGGVLKFRDCDNILVEQCGLFGCGILGIQASDCADLEVADSEIYECSEGGLMLERVSGVNIYGCTFRDLGGDRIMLLDCEDVTMDGAALDGNAQIP